MTLSDASANVGDERQPAAQVPHPARQHRVSSWEAVRELVHRHLRHLLASHRQGDGTREPRHPSPARPLHHHRRLSSGAAGHRQPGLPALRGWQQAGFSPLARHLAPPCRGISWLFPGSPSLVLPDSPGCAVPRRPLRATAGRARGVRGAAWGGVRRERRCGKDGKQRTFPPGALG